ncbi:MAG: glycosyltransferase [Dehalococcoidales bacterium]|nr:glycosyltransferase [Dehalococcoidales bacterium]
MIDRVLFLIEKYCDADPACGPTNAESMVVGALESTGLVGQLKHFYYDVLAKTFGQETINRMLLEDCDLFRPQAIVYTPMMGLLGVQLNPSKDTLKELRHRGIKIYTHLWDTCGREREMVDWFHDVSDAIGDVASNADRFHDPKFIQVWSAVDPRVFYDRKLNRDIDISFIGSVDLTGKKWPQRVAYINALRNSGINVVVRGGQRGDRVSWEEYAKLLCRSKISLNFSMNIPTPHCQIKGRVFESMACGTMLLEDNGDMTRRFFEPGVDFVMFDCGWKGDQLRFDDLLNKVKYYLAHEDERLKIAKSGREKVTTKYSAQSMWEYILRSTCG